MRRVADDGRRRCAIVAAVAAKRASVDDELARLKASPEPAVIAAALSSKHARVVAAAAGLVKARTLEGHAAALQAAYQRFLEDPVKRDPGCRAKLAVLEALDFTESMDEQPFVAAASLVQLEPAWGAPVDTAAPCRARAVLALARMGHPDAVLIAGTLLADAEVPVRNAAADALSNSGVRHAAGVLLHKLGVGDEDPLVLLACMAGVLLLAPELALARFVPWLSGSDSQRRELAAVCLGQSTLPAAAQALIAALEGCVLSKERAVLLRALGLHRSDAALDALVTVVEGDNETDAAAAVRALAPRRFEASVRARVRQAVSGRGPLERAFAEAFKDE